MSEPLVVVCEAGATQCGRVVEPSPTRLAEVLAIFDKARALMESAGLWAGAPVLVLDARLGGATALTLTISDAGAEGLGAFAGRPAILFAEGMGGETDLDVVLHELTHVWMRSRGASDTRWRIEDGRANHESAVVHEGLADFVAAALTHDPILSVGTKAMSHSVRAVARCPDDLTGHAHADSLLVSNALWELGDAGRSSTAMADVVAAVVQSAVDGSRGVEALVSAVTHAVADQPALALRWQALVKERGLRECHQPIGVGVGIHGGVQRVSARTHSFLAAGTQRFDRDEVIGPLQFTANVAGIGGVRVTGRSSQRDSLTLVWRAEDALGEVLERGRAPLIGWPSQYATLTLPPSSHALTFGLVSSAVHDITYNDIAITALDVDTREVATPTPQPRSGCSQGSVIGALDLVVPLLVGWAVWAKRQRLGKAMCNPRIGFPGGGEADLWARSRARHPSGGRLVGAKPGLGPAKQIKAGLIRPVTRDCPAQRSGCAGH